MRPLSGFVVASLLLAARFACAQSNMVLFISQSGDYIGQGRTYATTNTGDFSISGGPTLITVGAFGFDFYFAGPGGAALTVGVYLNSARWPFNGSAPGLDISGNGRGCNTECGSFQVLELHTDGSGLVDRYWVTFSNKCECYNAPMTGEIRYHSQLAPPTPVPRIIRVPADVATIQAGINTASPFGVDTVLVSPGTYFENLNFNGHAVAVMSAGGPQVTIIDGNNAGAVANFSTGEGANSIISGFTLRHGYSSYGSGISLLGASPTITSNIFESNAQAGGYYGAAIGGNGASPIIKQNLFRNNTADSQYLSGVVSFVNGSSPLIANNIFLRNSCRAINLTLPTGNTPVVINNTIVSNSVGIRVDARVDTTAHSYLNNILVGNTVGLQVDFWSPANYPLWAYNLVIGGQNYTGIPDQTGANGNISVDPLFTCLPSDDYHLLAGSPCIDAGTSGAPRLPGIDFDGNPRVLAGTKNGVATVDMGAYEFNPASPPVPCLYVYCPANIAVVAAAGQTSATVTYPAPTGVPAATITGAPPSGSVFNAGTNIVTCTAAYGTNSASCTFTIAVLVTPTITSQSGSTNVLAGQSLSLSVTPAGTAPFTYRWLFENATISGAVNSTFTIDNAQPVNEGIYRCVVANAAGSVTGAPIAVRVLPSAPIILTNPVALSVPASSNASFSVSVIGSQPLGYQWLFNRAAISGATAAQYSLAGVQSGNSGSYQVVVANSLGSATSAVATLTVTPLAPYFITQPVGAAVSAGSSRTLVGVANGSQPIGYQWQRNGNNLAGASQTALTLTSLAVADSGAYTLVASNIAGVCTSAVAQLTVYQNPTLVQGLTNQVADINTTVVLAVNTLGSPTLAYAWQLNGQAITGAGPTLTLTNIQPTQAGYYRVTVTNQYGSVSSTGRVSVLGWPSWVTAWGDNSGGQTNVPANLKDIVAVSGGDYHSVALRHNGSLLAWGYNGDGQTTVPTSALRFVSVAAGAAHNLAITENGSVVGWGRNEAGQRNVPASAASGVLAVAAGDAHSLALLSTGTVVAWGDNTFGQISVPQGLSGVRAIAAGRNHCLALRTNGAVVGWGFNVYGQASAPVVTNAMGIAAGYLHSVALLSDGTVVVWGDNTYGQANVPAGLSNVVAVAAGDFHTLALRADGTVVGWGDDSYGQTDLPSGLANVWATACGNYHGLALTPAPGGLQPSLLSSGLIIRWTGLGTLQWAPTPLGPYADVGCQGTIYTNLDMTVPAKFFRLRR
jgi:hypothetical protein